MNIIELAGWIAFSLTVVGQLLLIAKKPITFLVWNIPNTIQLILAISRKDIPLEFTFSFYIIINFISFAIWKTKKAPELNHLSKAIQLAATSHNGQVDKGGKPYILHPLRVMMAQTDEASKICGVLHDVIEDTTITLNDLINMGFSKEVVDAVDCISRRKGERYNDYLDRVLTNKIACSVKLADLKDNMDISRIPNPTEKDYKRLDRYKTAEKRLAENIE